MTADRGGVPYYFAIMFVIAAVGIVLFVRPAAEELRDARSLATLLEQRYEMLRFQETLQVGAAYVDDAPNIVVAYNELYVVLSRVSSLASLYDLRQVSFLASEPVGLHLEGSIVEMRVRAEYEGSIDSFSGFLYGLDCEMLAVNDVNITADRLIIGLSIFAYRA